MVASVVAAQETIRNTLATSHSLTVPAGAANGHRLLVIANTGKNNVSPGMSWGGGFVERMDQTATEGGTVTLSMAELEVSGTPPATVTVSTVNNSRCTAVILAITGHDPATPTEIAFTLHSSDPPNLAPSWGSAATLFGAVHSGNEDPFPPPAYMLPDERHEVQGSHTKLYLCMQTLTAASLNPSTWQSGSPETSQRVVATFAVRGATASATDLVVADAAQAHSSDSPTLTQVHNLAVADAAQAHAADSPALTQLHQLVAQDAGQAQTVDAPTLAVIHHLEVADATQVQSADGLTLTQAHILAAGDASQTQTADTVELAHIHQLTAADATHGQATDSLSLTQLHEITVADAAQASTAEAVTLSVGGIDLLVSDAAQAQTVDAPSLTQAHNLTVIDAGQGQSAETSSLTQLHLLVAADALHGHTADVVTLHIPSSTPDPVAATYAESLGATYREGPSREFRESA